MRCVCCNRKLNTSEILLAEEFLKDLCATCSDEVFEALAEWDDEETENQLLEDYLGDEKY